jgi:hypothetical protein
MSLSKLYNMENYVDKRSFLSEKEPVNESKRVVVNTNFRIILFFGLGLIISLFSCKESSKTIEGSPLKFPPKPQPKGYVCYRTTAPVSPDGILDEKDWTTVPWTDDFVDIEGSVKLAPRFKTRAKMLWDDSNLYIAAELEEPHVWATLRQRDTIIFMDHDFEIFIDPDGDTQAYYELEVNALGTAWDLFLLKPYRDGGPAIFGWDIAGLKVGTHINGTINNPQDMDKSWTVEIIIPLKALLIEWPKARVLPKGGDQWRINFSRVEWRTKIDDNYYIKELNPNTGKPFPEDNWVWSPQGQINMHMPEMWGYLQFSSLQAGTGKEEFEPDVDIDLKWGLRMVYYAEKEYFAKNKTYSSSLADIGLKQSDFPKNLSVPVIHSTTTTFECYFPPAGKNRGWTIYHDGRIVNLNESLIAN